MQKNIPTDLFALLDFAGMEEEEKEEILSEMGKCVFEGALYRVFETLEEKDLIKLTALFEATNQDPENEEKAEALDDFLAEHAPDFPLFLREEAELLHKEWQAQLEGK